LHGCHKRHARLAKKHAKLAKKHLKGEGAIAKEIKAKREARRKAKARRAKEIKAKRRADAKERNSKKRAEKRRKAVYAKESKQKNKKAQERKNKVKKSELKVKRNIQRERKHKRDKVIERKRKRKEKIKKQQDAAGLYRDKSVKKALDKKRNEKKFDNWHWLRAPKLKIRTHEYTTKDVETGKKKHHHSGNKYAHPKKFAFPKGQPNKREVEKAVKLAARTARRDERRYRRTDEVPEGVVTEAVNTKISLPTGAKPLPASSLIGDAQRVYQLALDKESSLRHRLHKIVKSLGTAHPNKVHKLEQELAVAKRRVLVDKAGLEVVQRQVLKKG